MSRILILIVFIFSLFVLLMSAIYIYHWNNFAMGDNYIKKFTFIYLIGLVVLSIPFLLLIFA